MISATIPSDLEQFVCDAVAAGKYQSADDVVSAGLRLLRDHNIEALCKEIDVGLQQMERGEVIDIDSAESHEALLADIKRSGRDRLNAAQSQ
jgi:putative addiction module CopG family antidote